MIGISEVIQTIGAMIIFSLLLLTANRMILMNTMREVETEAVGVATTIAQSIIKEAQTKAFDAETADGTIPLALPEGFSSCGASDPSNPRYQYNDFDDYDDYDDIKVDTKLGLDSFEVDVTVKYVSSSEGFDISKGSTTEETMFKKMVVTVTGKYLEEWQREIKLSYLRRYYKK